MEQGLPSSMAWSMNKFVYVGVGVYVLDPSCANSTCAQSFSASPLKHHVTGRQGCPNPDNYPDSEAASRSRGSQPVSNSYVLSAKQSSRTSNFNVCCLTRPGIEPPTSQTHMPGECSTTTLPGHGHPRRNCLLKRTQVCLLILSRLTNVMVVTLRSKWGSTTKWN